MDRARSIELAAVVLATGGALVDGIQSGTTERGFTDIRPMHGFAFVRLAPSGATVSELAAHLGVTKQAASQLVDELVAKGYVHRGPHPHDARAKLVTLTEHGWACTEAADAAAADMVAGWVRLLGEERVEELRRDLVALAPRGRRVRPAW